MEYSLRRFVFPYNGLNNSLEIYTYLSHMRGFLVFFICCLSGVILHAQEMSSDSTDTQVKYPSLTELKYGNVLLALDLKDQQGMKVLQEYSEVFCPQITHRAIFCRMEDQLLKSSKLPLKLRLGDVQYTDRMEGKNVHDEIRINPN